MVVVTKQGITQDKFNAIQAQVSSKLGMNISGNKGSAEKLDIEITWDFDPSTGVVVLTCPKKPFVVSDKKVEDALNALGN